VTLAYLAALIPLISLAYLTSVWIRDLRSPARKKVISAKDFLRQRVRQQGVKGKPRTKNQSSGAVWFWIVVVALLGFACWRVYWLASAPGSPDPLTIEALELARYVKMR
jgi:hypothetical protein